MDTDRQPVQVSASGETDTLSPAGRAEGTSIAPSVAETSCGAAGNAPAPAPKTVGPEARLSLAPPSAPAEQRKEKTAPSAVTLPAAPLPSAALPSLPASTPSPAFAPLQILDKPAIAATAVVPLGTCHLAAVQSETQSRDGERAWRRMAWVLAPLLAVFALLALRLAYLQLWEGARWERLSQLQTFKTEAIAAPRGPILCSDGGKLAHSTPRRTVFADLSLLRSLDASDRAEQVSELSALLNQEPHEIERRLASDRRVVYLKRNLDPLLCDQIAARRFTGIGFEDTYARSYPWGRRACHLVGFAGPDGGQEGLEKQLEAMLTGIPGRRVLEYDAGRRVISRGESPEGRSVEVAPRPGLSLTLTLHPLIQHVAEEELARVAKAYKPQGAVALVLDVRNGAILALACRPDFDPNLPAEPQDPARRNRALTDCYEPGSTFKTFILAHALETGAVRRSEQWDCENGAWRLPWRTLHDTHSYRLLTTDLVIVLSSNIGAAKFGQKLGLAGVRRAVELFGFGRLTRIDLPGEVSGLVRPFSRWTKDSLLSIPMGQEISVTPLQLLCAYGAMVNGGVLLRPQIVARLQSPGGETLYEMQPQPVRRAISSSTSAAMREILTRAVLQGTGRPAWCAEYSIGGKTGTAQKVENGRYSHEKYVGSFCGFAPAGQPRLVCLVTVDEPAKELGYYGATVAAPAVKEILRRSLHVLGVPARSPNEQAAATEEYRQARQGRY